MTDENTPTTDTTQTTPATPLGPAMTAMKVVPPIVPLATWTWNSPVIPSFYWNVYSAEQRIRQICMEIGRIEAYLDYFGAYANRAHGELNKRIDVLTAKLTEEVNRLDKRIDEENEARKNADELLQQGLDAETARAKAAEKVLQTNVDTVQSNLDNEATIRKNADDKLTADLAAEIARAKAAEQKNATNIANETTAREDADTALGNRITDEVEDRTNADNALGNRIDAVDARVTQEVTDRTQADTRIMSKVTVNETNIATNADNIAKEIVRAKAAEESNTSLINANKNAADESDKRIQDSLDTEIANRKNGERTLTESLNNEATARTEADTALGGRIDTETSNRQTADNLLTQQVNRRVMATNVKAADNSHITVDTATSDTDPDGTTVTIGSTFDADFDSLNTKVNNLDGKIEHETSDRETADSALDVRVKALESTLPSKISKVAHDDTLKGSGTSGDPLKVNLNHATVMNDTGKTVYPTLMHANGDAATINGIGFNVGDGLTAYNSEDADVGSGLRISDEVMANIEKAENALTTVHTSGLISGDGTLRKPLRISPSSGTTATGAQLTYLEGSQESDFNPKIGIPVATANTVGVVKPDMETVFVDGQGVLTATTAGGTGLTEVHYDDTTQPFDGSGTDASPLILRVGAGLTVPESTRNLSMEHALNIRTISYTVNSSVDITTGYYVGAKAVTLVSTDVDPLPEGTEAAFDTLFINGAVGKPFNITERANQIIVPMSTVPTGSVSVKVLTILK